MGYDALRLRTSGIGGLAEAKIADARFMFEQELENDASAVNDICLCDGIKPSKPLVIRTFYDKYSATGGHTRKYAVKLRDSLKIGDLLYDCDENTYWLCKTSVKKSGIYCTGVMQRCVEMPLRWQDDEGNVFEYPVFDYSGFNSDETDYKVVNVGEGRRRLVTIADDNTVRLKHDKRFFWDRNTETPSVFKITQINSTSLFYDKGLVEITIIEDQYNPQTDDIGEWLCNYKKTADKAVFLQYNGDNKIRVGRSRRVWVEPENPVAWTVDAPKGISYEEENGSIKISVPLDETLIGECIGVSAVVNGVMRSVSFDIVGGV